MNVSRTLRETFTFPVLPGLQVCPHMVEDSLKGFIEQSSRFLGKVFVGDTLYATLQVESLAPNRSTGVLVLKSTVHNQRSELVMDGLQKYLLLKRPAEVPPAPVPAVPA